MQGAAAAACGVSDASVGVAGTGVIGVQLPMDEVKRGILDARGALAPDGGSSFARSIMTTDNGPKHCSVSCDGVTLSAQAKGAGMMQPSFATLLCFVQTDAIVDDPAAALRSAAEASFGRITVDGLTSTNDSVFLQATGAAGKPLPDGLLDQVLLQLAMEVLADGEGATRVARVDVSGAADAEEAERVARTIANSQLVQTAVFGHDPNWGRIVQAAGQALAGQELDLDGSNVTADELGGDEPEVELGVRLDRGDSSAHVFCSDLTYDYVRINAEYTT
jgi:glutamate N-acetyltransferase/amino-acid N-acetyltransferase